MSYKSVKQRLASTVFRQGWSRRLWLDLQCLPGRGPGRLWGKNRQWSEHGEDARLLELAREYLADGFYVDVGANLPTKRSNTFRLYCHGMRGICLEPNLELAALYERVRPGDEVICAAVGAQPGLGFLHRFNYHVYSTCSESEGKRRAESASPRMRTELLRRSPVPVVSLKEVLAGAGGRFQGPFFLLKTDTEGLDLEVLRSLDWERTRPLYVLSESTGATGEVRAFLEENGYDLLEQFPSNQLFASREQSHEK